MNAAEQLISQARHGRFGALLPELLEMAKRPGGPRDQAWEAAAAAIQTLFWQDRFAEAADLAETVIAQDGPLGGELCDQDVPFRHAFLAAELHAGVPAGPRLLAAAEHIPAGRNLGEDLLWPAEQLPEQPKEALLPNHADWGGPTKPLAGPGAELADREFSELTTGDKQLVWQALAKANDFQRAHALAETSGETPDRFALCTWMAGWYALEGDIPRGERMLLAAHARWWPYMKWDAIPGSPVLQPTLRLVTTDHVREHYLTRPIGPEAAERNA
ncbi:hypothetical protein ACFVZM_18115 [Streptomyces sioyaensis]|uniref:hypothetical protein n=1 Tax=Streptomyces sioyaensis TaxID=67364 RepID=UPI0036AFAA7F